MLNHTFKVFVLLFLFLSSYFSISQTIINTENMITDLDDNFSYNMNFQGDLNFGNIDLIQFSTAQQLSKSNNQHLFRLLLKHLGQRLPSFLYEPCCSFSSPQTSTENFDKLTIYRKSQILVITILNWLLIQVLNVCISNFRVNWRKVFFCSDFINWQEPCISS